MIGKSLAAAMALWAGASAVIVAAQTSQATVGITQVVYGALVAVVTAALGVMWYLLRTTMGRVHQLEAWENQRRGAEKERGRHPE